MTNVLTDRVLRTVPLEACDAPELDVRIERNDERIEELGRDIVTRGQIYPVHVFEKGERFEVVEGETRRLAMLRQGLTTVEAFVYPTKTLALEGVKYAGNMFRTDMTPADEAHAFFELFKNQCGEDITRVASLVGRSVTYVDARLRLLMGDELVLEAVAENAISLGVAERLNKIDKSDWRRYYLTLAVRDGITIAIAEQFLQDYRKNHADRPGAAATPASTSGPIIQHTYESHRCYICGEIDARFVPEIVPVHTHCKLAVLDKLLEAARGGRSSN